MFSRSRVSSLEPLIREKAQKLCDYVQRCINSGSPCDLHHGFRAVATDVVTAYTFDACFNLLDEDDLGAEFHGQIRAVGAGVWLLQVMTSLVEISDMIPAWLVGILSPPVKATLDLQDSFARDIEALKKRRIDKEHSERPTVFTSLLSTSCKAEGFVPPSTTQLTHEAFSLIFAGSDTSGNAMTIASFHVMSNPRIYSRLTKELSNHFPDSSQPLSYAQLEHLPYLVCVIPSHYPL
jgi:cytochrome P450